MIELGNGLFIETSSELIEQQKDWHEDDASKNTDFSVYPFWLTTDNGVDPEGFNSIEDIKNHLKVNGIG